MSSRTLILPLSIFRLVALVAAVSHLLVGLVDAHGYVTSPASRAYFCKTGQAKNCGEIQYEPQSVEAPKGLPFARSGDGKLCSAGLTQFSQLDRQGSTVWPTTQASDVKSFSWTFTAQHATTSFKYFITRPDWDASTTHGLTASDFESDPFLTVAMNGKAPPATMTHDLSKSMPARSGYHVVYAVWTVDNTANAFYQCIDLNFGGKSTGSPSFPPVAASSPKPSNAAGSSSTAPSSSAANSGSNPASSSSANTGTGGSTSSGSGSAASSNASTAASQSGAGTTKPATSASTGPRNHSTKGKACRLKRRQPSSSVLAARADFGRQQMRMQKRRSA